MTTHEQCRNRRLSAGMPVSRRPGCIVCGAGPCPFQGENEPVTSAPLPHDYKNIHTIAELRSDRTDDPRDWKPRDLLVSLLRMIDSGEIKPETMFVVHAEAEPDTHDKAIQSWVAGPSRLKSVGVAKLGLLMLEDDVMSDIKSK